MQLPMEERHIHPRQHIEDSLAVRMGGRAAELLVYGDLSTGASNDLVGNTELARKMVREWGMSDKIGPMAWGSQGQVFLGEDLMHTRDYSEHTSQVIDDEVELILRAQEQRALEVLARHRGGLDAVARALLDEETIDGETVGRLVDTAYGRPVHAPGVKSVPPIFVASQHGPTGADNVDGPPTDATPVDGAVPPAPAPVPSTTSDAVGTDAASSGRAGRFRVQRFRQRCRSERFHARTRGRSAGRRRAAPDRPLASSTGTRAVDVGTVAVAAAASASRLPLRTRRGWDPVAEFPGLSSPG